MTGVSSLIILIEELVFELAEEWVAAGDMPPIILTEKPVFEAGGTIDEELEEVGSVGAVVLELRATVEPDEAVNGELELEGVEALLEEK